MERQSAPNAEGETTEKNSSSGPSCTIKVSYIVLQSYSSKRNSYDLANLTILCMANSKLYVSNHCVSQFAYVTVPLP